MPRTGCVLILAIFLVLLQSAGARTPSAGPSVVAATGTLEPVSPQYGLQFDYLLIVVMSNHAICDVLTSCGGVGAFATALANGYGLATHYVGCRSSILSNYLCLTGGSDFGCSRYEGVPNSNNCTRSAWNATNIMDRLETAGLTWKAYMENMPSNCYAGNVGSYVVRHNPFVYYGDIAGNATRCARVVPAGTSDKALLDDLKSTSTASNYMWLTPNTCHAMYVCPVDRADDYLSHLVLPILGSNVFKTRRAALFLTFDQDGGGTGRPNVLTVWAGPAAAANYTSSRFYNHSSLLATIEANWDLAPLTSSDRNARNMGEFFTNPSGPDTIAPQITVTSPADGSVVPPATVTVTGTASDNVAVGRIELSTDYTTWTAANGTTSWAGNVTLVNGPNAIFVRATDLSGNQVLVRVNVTASPSAAPDVRALPVPYFLLVGVPLAAAATVLAVFLWRRGRPYARMTRRMLRRWQRSR